MLGKIAVILAWNAGVLFGVGAVTDDGWHMAFAGGLILLVIMLGLMPMIREG